MSYKHFSIDERICLQDLLIKNKSFHYIAQVLGRSVSSISREVKRNSSKKGYNSWRATNLYTIRRRTRSVKPAIPPNSELMQYIIDKLNLFWPPETIINKWKEIHPDSHISFSTVYRYIKKGLLPNITRQTHLRRRGKRKYPRSANTNSIQPEHLIINWPPEIVNRSFIGHFEGDTVLGGVGKGALVTMVDRKSKYLIAKLIKTKTAKETKEAIIDMFKDIPVNSISLDNGSEFAEFKAIEEELETTVYFAEPHKPWQRGLNENTNDILRFYYPKGFNFLNLDEHDLQNVVNSINNRPRKTLGWKTPHEIFTNHLKSVALA